MAEKFADKLQKIEDNVVGTYKKIENGAVEGFSKVSDGFIDKFFSKEGETVEETKARMAAQNEMIKKSIEASKNAGKR